MSTEFNDNFPDWTIVRSSFGADPVRSTVVPEEIWIDKGGTLTLSRDGRVNCDAYRLCFDGQIAVDLMLGEKKLVEITLADGVPASTRDHFLADQVLPRMLAHQGNLVLHAGAVMLGEGGVAILGNSGAGKSTLIASFDQAGSDLLGDDALIVDLAGGRAAIRSVYPSLRLFPDSIDRFFPSAATLDVAHYTPKQRIRLELANKNARSLVPLDALFIIGEPADDDEIAIRRLSIAKACMALIENSFMLDPTDMERARVRMQLASKLAGEVAAFALVFPRDYDRLPEVRGAILDAINDLRLARGH